MSEAAPSNPMMIDDFAILPDGQDTILTGMLVWCVGCGWCGQVGVGAQGFERVSEKAPGGRDNSMFTTRTGLNMRPKSIRNSAIRTYYQGRSDSLNRLVNQYTNAGSTMSLLLLLLTKYTTSPRCTSS